MCAEMELEAAAGNTERFFEINHDFHALLVRASGNQKLQELHAQLIAQMGRLLTKSVELRGGVQQSAAEHRGILAAVDAGDPEQAARLLEEHIEVPQRVLAASEAVALFADGEEPAARAQPPSTQPQDEEPNG
jgi:DNA-binding GntR family transcriptional regulator